MSNGTNPSTLDKWVMIAEAMAAEVFAATKPQYAPIATQIGAGIIEAEQMKAAGTLTDKLAHVQSIGVNAIAAFNTAKGSQVIDPAGAADLIAAGLTTTIKAINLVHAKEMGASPLGPAPAGQTQQPAPTGTSGYSTQTQAPPPPPSTPEG